MTSSAENGEIVRTIIMLARNLQMEVVAEGVETEEQLLQLKSLRCDFAQGYLFSPPRDATEAGQMLGAQPEPVTGYSLAGNLIERRATLAA